MRKGELIEAIQAQQPLFTKSQIAAFIGAMKAAAIASIEAGDTFEVPGLMKLEPITRRQREGRNPKTGETITIPSRRSVRAKPGHEIVAAAKRETLGSVPS